MCVNCNHTIHRSNHHFGWDRSFAPKLIAKSGETIHFECTDSSGGQLHQGSTVKDIATLDFGKINPVTGPVYVEGAMPGDVLKVTPRNVGGNMDIRDLSQGTTLYLPVEVEGALFSIGDTHAAQGDGEVCGTAIESQMDVEVTLEVIKGRSLKSPRFTTPGPVTRHLDADGYEVTTGIGPDLMTAARESVARMIDLLGVEHGLSPIDAYLLVSVCGDLRISEIVDLPNWVISFYFPRLVLA
jgi:acetamidase/formamidase